jgi:bifunctional non-homologous end joining protein LigD
MAREPAWLRSLDQAERDAVRASDQPRWTAPMLATLHDASFDDENWVFERKLDGIRFLGFRQDGAVRLRSRNDKSLDDRFPEIVTALEQSLDTDAIVDGEVVAFAGNLTSFQRLQGRVKRIAAGADTPVYAYLFDLLYIDGYDITGLPLLRRKAILKETVKWDDPLRFTPHRREQGRDYHREACSSGWEGVIGKRADATYRHSRSRDWLKLTCSNNQELVIGGFTDPQGQRQDFGALLLGYYPQRGANGDQLIYAGKVGTGFDSQTLASLGRQLRQRERQRSPFVDGPDRPGIHFVTPELVAQIGFTEWTDDGRLRHPRFQGLRDDKSATEVVREEPS